MSDNGTHDGAQASNDDVSTSDSAGRFSRRSVLKATGAAAVTAGFADALMGSVAAVGIDTPQLHRDGNKLKDPSGNEVILRGVNIADPARLARSWRGKDTMGVFEKATSTDDADEGGWYSRIIRIPTQPQDISSAANDLQMVHDDDWGPLLPGQIDESDMETYFSTYVDPLVDAAEEQGLYVMIDYHRHFPIFHQPQNEADIGEYQCGAETFPNDLGFCGERGVLWHSEDQASELDGYTEEYAAELDEELHMFWNFVAPRYSDRSHVIYDVYNEPTGPYAGDWGAPDRVPHAGEDAGQDTDVMADVSKQYWDMWVERAQPWIDTVREHADNLLTIGSPRWSQYTYWAPQNEFQGEDICYTGHVYTHDSLRPLSDYYGTPAEEVPVFFSEFGWAEGGGKDNFSFLEGTADEYADEFETFIDEYPVHPICWNFDHTWEPAFFQHDSSQDGTWEIWDYQARPGQWWQDYLEQHRNDDLPNPDEEDTATTTTTTTTQPSTPTPTDSPTPTDEPNTPTDTPTPTDAPETPSEGLVVDNYDGDPGWSSHRNDLGEWCGAGSFENGSGEESGGELTLEYDNGGWFQEQINRDVSDYSTLVFTVRGADGGEESEILFDMGGVRTMLADVTDDSVGTSTGEVRVDLESAGVDRSSPSVRLNFWQGGSSTLAISGIHLE
ncbi:glycoside hydrolase family 5 protein [Halosimplex halophilum]|uniref:glycoside hydrolase family 5 protein n=1 Tax=Halosimplex halophilum TaxID=2559572 RepID=UPI00107F924E|nr:cellulase family glycosylhydrolase [Halosimplex halophilum]